MACRVTFKKITEVTGRYEVTPHVASQRVF
jgi:hypothetical protein